METELIDLVITSLGLMSASDRLGCAAQGDGGGDGGGTCARAVKCPPSVPSVRVSRPHGGPHPDAV